MGTSNGKETSGHIADLPHIKSVDICIKLNKFKDKTNYLGSKDWNVFNLDSTLKEIADKKRNLYFILYPEYNELLTYNLNLIHEINFVEAIDEKNSIPLYEIQNRSLFDLKDFKDLILTNPDKNKSIWYKVSIPGLAASIPSVPSLAAFLTDIEIVKIHYDQDLDSDSTYYDKTLREYLKVKYAKVFGPEIQYVFFIGIEKEDSVNTTQQYRDLINTNLGYTIKDLKDNFKNNYLIHNTYNFDIIFKSKKLCNSGECDKIGFDEKTGKFNYKVKLNPRELIPEMPGIYFTHFEFTKPLTLESKFKTNNYNSLYGDIGIVYSVEYLFSKYHVNLKSDQGFGYGEDIDIDSYFHLNGDEAIVRANTIPLKDISFLVVNITGYEKKFIYDSLGYNKDFTFKDVIDLYNTNNKSKWYIRKSNLLKIIKLYKYNSVKKNMSNLPPIFISYFKQGLKDYGTIYDTDSDKDLMD